MSPRASVHIRSAQDIFEALDSPQLGIRLSMLQAISQHPTRAMAYGHWIDQDLVDKLIASARTEAPSMVRAALVNTIACFQDPRVSAFLAEELRSTTDAEAVFGLEERLRLEPPEMVRGLLFGAAATPAPALLAARMLADAPDLSPRERLRVAVLSAVAVAPPPLDASTVDGWIDELNGEFGERASALLQHEMETPLVLWDHWAALSAEARVWLVEWTSQRHAEAATRFLGLALRTAGDDRVARAALTAAARLSLDALREDAEAWLDHADPTLQAAAVSLGAGDAERLALDATRSIATRLAAIRRVLSVEVLIALFHDDGWELRAAATERLVVLGEPAVEAVRPLVFHDSLPVRVAAVQTLWSLGQEEWLEDNLIG